MITVGMNYDVVAGKEGAFEKKFALVMAAMESMPGHSSTRLYSDAHREGSYLVVSEWSSEEAYREFVASEEFAKVTRWGREVVLKGRPSHRVYGEKAAEPTNHGKSSLESRREAVGI